MQLYSMYFFHSFVQLPHKPFHLTLPASVHPSSVYQRSKTTASSGIPSTTLNGINVSPRCFKNGLPSQVIQ